MRRHYHRGACGQIADYGSQEKRQESTQKTCTTRHEQPRHELVIHEDDVISVDVHAHPGSRQTWSTTRICTVRTEINSELILAGRKIEFESRK